MACSHLPVWTLSSRRCGAGAAAANGGRSVIAAVEIDRSAGANAAPHARPTEPRQALFPLVTATSGHALRSRERRFESCRGRKIEHAIESWFLRARYLTWPNDERTGPAPRAARPMGAPRRPPRNHISEVSMLGATAIRTVCPAHVLPIVRTCTSKKPRATRPPAAEAGRPPSHQAGRRHPRRPQEPPAPCARAHPTYPVAPRHVRRVGAHRCARLA